MATLIENALGNLLTMPSLHLVIGQTRSGKTNLVKHCLSQIDHGDAPTPIFIYAPWGQDAQWRHMCQVAQVEGDHLYKILDGVTASLKAQEKTSTPSATETKWPATTDKKIKAILIIEGGGVDTKTFKTQQLRALLLNNRHLGLWVFITIQTLQCITPEIRANADYLSFMAPIHRLELQRFTSYSGSELGSQLGKAIETAKRLIVEKKLDVKQTDEDDGPRIAVTVSQRHDQIEGTTIFRKSTTLDLLPEALEGTMTAPSILPIRAPHHCINCALPYPSDVAIAEGWRILCSSCSKCV